MTKARNVLTANYTFSDEGVEIGEIDGLAEAIEFVNENRDERVLVRQEDRVSDYDVYWNDKTDSVRFAAVVPGASYEVPDEFFEQARLTDTDQ